MIKRATIFLLLAIGLAPCILFAQLGKEAPPPRPNLTAVSGKAVVMIYRNDSFLYGDHFISLFISGNSGVGGSIGSIGGVSYVRLVLPAGKYVLGATGRAGSAKLTFNTERDKVYFVWVDTQLAIGGPKPLLSTRDEAQGRSDLESCSFCTEAQGVITDSAELGLTTPVRENDAHQRLQTLKRLFDDRLITNEEYEAKRKQILEGL